MSSGAIQLVVMKERVGEEVNVKLRGGDGSGSKEKRKAFYHNI